MNTEQAEEMRRLIRETIRAYRQIDRLCKDDKAGVEDIYVQMKKARDTRSSLDYLLRRADYQASVTIHRAILDTPRLNKHPLSARLTPRG